MKCAIRSATEFDSLRNGRHVDVAITGGGITDLTATILAVIERERIGCATCPSIEMCSMGRRAKRLRQHRGVTVAEREGFEPSVQV